jgi:hypothetical protein
MWVLILVFAGLNGAASVQSATGFKTEQACQVSANEFRALDDKGELLLAVCKKMRVNNE